MVVQSDGLLDSFEKFFGEILIKKRRKTPSFSYGDISRYLK